MTTRRLLAVVAGLLTGLLAFVFWLVGRAQYVEDYCTERAPLPAGAGPEPRGEMRLAYMDGLTTIRCDYSAYPDVVVQDGTVLAATVFLALAVLVVWVLLWRWSRGPTAGAHGTRMT